jgi:predicted DNA-binding mobile mystery protein A
MKKILLQQYQEIVDQAAGSTVAELSMPKEGWILTLRKALGMSGAQLGRRMGVSRSQVAQSEKNELSGALTLKTLQNMAQAMGGRLVYAIVLEQKTGNLVTARAKEKAEQLVSQTDTQMAFEQQSLSAASRNFEVDRVREELLSKMPKDLWDDA